MPRLTRAVVVGEVPICTKGNGNGNDTAQRRRLPGQLASWHNVKMQLSALAQISVNSVTQLFAAAAAAAPAAPANDDAHVRSPSAVEIGVC